MVEAALYEISNDMVVQSSGWLNTNQRVQMHAMCSMLAEVVLNRSDDGPSWMKNKNENFTLKTLYEKLFVVGQDRSFKHVRTSNCNPKSRFGSS